MHALTRLVKGIDGWFALALVGELGGVDLEDGAVRVMDDIDTRFALCFGF